MWPLLLLALSLYLLPCTTIAQVNLGVLNTTPLPIRDDPSIVYDYDIVYVRAPRDTTKKMMLAEANFPIYMTPGADLMLLHPDGTEELLVEGGATGAVGDPFVTFDSASVLYSHYKDIANLRASSADIWRIDLATRQKTQLTFREYTPNTGVSGNLATHPQGVFNIHPAPLAGNRIVFVSSRNGFVSPRNYSDTPTLQLFVMDSDGKNVEWIAPMNIGGALHPIPLIDGRIAFSSAESQGLRGVGLWGLWSIHPDGTHWAPMLSAFNNGSVDQITHFQTQLGNGNIVIEEYYNQNNWGFGNYWMFPIGQTFGPAYLNDTRNPRLRVGRHLEAPDGGIYKRLAFSPTGITSLTPFVVSGDYPSGLADLRDPQSPRLGKFTHPSAAPENHLLTVWSPGPVNHNGTHLPVVDAGIYLLKDGKAIDDPGQLRLIKNSENFNEQWPRPLVSYRRLYGVDAPPVLQRIKGLPHLEAQLPTGTPYGLIGTSSFYKRESYPNGKVMAGSQASSYANDGYDRRGYEGLGAFNPQDQYGSPLAHWGQQGAEAGRYGNQHIHAVRILAMEPATNRNEARKFFSFANERLRILGEIPLRKFDCEQQTIDPDGNPDTSFLAKIPADTVFTFQTIDKHGMLLNASQTWHQLKPGEVRNDCGGCHAHSQAPTHFQDTAAAQTTYKTFDLTQGPILLTDKAKDESGKQWNTKNDTGIRTESSVKNVEFYRDIKPIFDRSCVKCHSEKNGMVPAGNLVLDDDAMIGVDYGGRSIGQVSGTYYRLVLDRQAKYGYKPLITSWRGQQATRYVRIFQSRRSLLVWKIYGERMDGWSNDDFPTDLIPGDPTTLALKGVAVPNTLENREKADLDYTGTIMPPPGSQDGSALAPDGSTVSVPALTDEDRRTIVRWIDLGLPIDQDYTANGRKPLGWFADEARPTLTLSSPAVSTAEPLRDIIIGMHDYFTGLDIASLTVMTDIPIDGISPGENLANQFTVVDRGVWRYTLRTPLVGITNAVITVSVKDKQGNMTQIRRVFSVGGV